MAAIRSSSKGLPPPGASSKGGTGGGFDPDVERYQNDLLLLTQKIADLTGEPQRAPPAPGSNKDASGFVSGLRSVTGENGLGDLKLTMLQKVIAKVAELDRLILKKTAPEKEVSARRGSRGMDLVALPTHLHITDRLMDLYAKAQRVTIIKKTEGGGGAPESVAPGSPRGDKKALEKLQQKLDDSEAKRKAVAEDCSEARRQTASLQKELDVLRTEMAKTASQASEEICVEHTEEVEKLKALLKEAQAEVSNVQEMLEVESSRAAAIVSELMSKSLQLREGGRGGEEKGNESAGGGSHDNDSGSGSHGNLSLEMIKALAALDEGLRARESALREQLVSMNSVHHSLEAENRSLVTNMEITNKDLETVQSELEAMRLSYHTLHEETVGKEGRGAAAEKELKQANDKLIELQSELVNAARKTLELERLPPLLEQEEERRRKAEEEKISLDSLVMTMEEELKQYKHLNEQLKQKIRDMSGKDATSKEFMDSFEDVMQDELMAMKGAFEAKLRVKSEQAEAMSVRHRQEIARLSANASPYTRSLM